MPVLENKVPAVQLRGFRWDPAVRSLKSYATEFQGNRAVFVSANPAREAERRDNLLTGRMGWETFLSNVDANIRDVVGAGKNMDIQKPVGGGDGTHTASYRERRQAKIIAKAARMPLDMLKAQHRRLDSLELHEETVATFKTAMEMTLSDAERAEFDMPSIAFGAE